MLSFSCVKCYWHCEVSLSSSQVPSARLLDVGKVAAWFRDQNENVFLRVFMGQKFSCCHFLASSVTGIVKFL